LHDPRIVELDETKRSDTQMVILDSYYLAQVIQEATGFLTVREIASAVGILNASHFTKSFKAAYGSSPAQHRAAHFRITAIKKGDVALGSKGLGTTARLGK